MPSLMTNPALPRVFVAVAIAEALSWTGLLIGMFFKYLTDLGELGVQIFGPVHGALFVLYVVVTLLVSRAYRWSPGTTLLGLACSIPPFATVAFELWVTRTGRMPTAGDREPDAHSTV
jgi:RND superfamily putative drug exporter